MLPCNTICIVIDGLRASALGTYGNTWYGTPALDHLAAESMVAEWMLTGAPSLASFYREAWDGVHALRSREPALSPAKPASHLTAESLPLRLAAAGYHLSLVTDDLWLDRYAETMSLKQDLWDAHWLNTETHRPAPTIAETAIGQVFTTAIEQFESWQDSQAGSNKGNLLWLHARGMHGSWDAPDAMRWELAEEDQLQPPTWVTPPQLEMSDDPDHWLGLRIAYAAQIKVLDACLGALLTAVDEMSSPLMVMLVGSRGFALGEHGRAGSDCRDLYNEQLHVPWLLRMPNELGEPPPRFTGLSQPFDLAATLLDWFGMENYGDGLSVLALRSRECSAHRHVVFVRDDEGQQVVRTPAWMLRQKLAEGSSSPITQLYTKPDDRWEINDVASRCPLVMDGMQAVLAEYQRRLASSVALEPFELDSGLLL